MQQPSVVKAYFEAQSAFWRDIYGGADVYAIIHQQRQVTALAWIDALELAPGSRALDVGCGAGFVTVALAQRGFLVHAVDTSAAMVEQTRQHALAAGIADRTNARSGSADDIPEPDDSFDLVVALGVIPWLDQPTRAIQEMARVLRPGGYLVLSADNASRLNYLLDPWLHPLVTPLKRRIRSRLRQSRWQRAELDRAGARADRCAAIDSELRHAGLIKLRGYTLGFGPFTFLRRRLVPEPWGTRLHYSLQRLADAGAPGLRLAGAQYLVLEHKPNPRSESEPTSDRIQSASLRTRRFGHV
jgi:ubiquinone/menaquinone biosynthesis C-methylase UbiE